MLRATVHGRRREIGLGAFPAVSLSKAPTRAAEQRIQIGEGRDPVAEKRRAKTPTFRQAAEKVYALNRPSWRAKSTPPTGWRRCAATRYPRSGSMRLSEIDCDAREWRVPASRMKSYREHPVPLSDAALAALDRVEDVRHGSGLLFPSPPRSGHPLSNMTLTKILRDMGLAEAATVHGFRSAFRDWASERTNAPHAAMELALAHTVGSAVEQAYARSDLLERNGG